MTHFNNLSPAEAERLALLMEEASEVVQACSKILRHGYASCHPRGVESNRRALERELGDLQVATDLMERAGDVSDGPILASVIRKTEKLPKFLHYNQHLFQWGPP